jgi:hypothetical protein
MDGTRGGEAMAEDLHDEPPVRRPGGGGHQARGAERNPVDGAAGAGHAAGAVHAGGSPFTVRAGHRRNEHRLGPAGRVGGAVLRGARQTQIDRVAVEAHAGVRLARQVIDGPAGGNRQAVAVEADHLGAGRRCTWRRQSERHRQGRDGHPPEGKDAAATRVSAFR